MMMMTLPPPLTLQTVMNDALNVLVTDDDVTDRMAIRRYLAKTPLQVTLAEAANAQTAQQMLASERFDCIFLDFQLPDIDGLSFIKQLRLVGETLPIIVLTGQGDEQIAVELMKAGASDYLAKSRLTPDNLTSLIRQTMKTYRAEQRVRAAQAQLQQTNLLLRQQNQELENQRQRIEQQNLQLQEANRHKTEFLATMSHELRTPLNSILGFSQILKSQTKGDLNEYQMKMTNCIHTNGESLLHLVNDILDMSTIEAHQLKLIPHAFDLAGLIQEVVSEIQVMVVQKELTLRTQINLVKREIYNDRQRFKQILTNLLSNAVKFTETGVISIEVNNLVENSLEIDVKDTGIGIAEEQLANIFQPFRQADQSTIRRYEGTGLGLAIAHSLVSAMQGSITVESQLGQGSTFRIQIPRQIVVPQGDS